MTFHFISTLCRALFVMLCFIIPAAAEEPVWKEGVLEQNEAFYRAFREGDLTAMKDVWGSDEPIILDHPHGDVFDTREKVIGYWSWALPGSSPDIVCDVTDVTKTGPTVTVYCDEYLFEGRLQMKNIFHKENGEWKMIYHGPLQQRGVS